MAHSAAGENGAACGKLAAIKTRMERGRPLGEAAWMARIVDRLNLGRTLRRKGWSTHEKV